MKKQNHEELAEAAFRDYYGAEKWQQWKSQYGDRLYSTYWSAPEEEKMVMKQELGIAAEQEKASARAAELLNTLRSSVPESGPDVKENKQMVENIIINTFREEPLMVRDLREDLYWKERLREHADSEHGYSHSEDRDGNGGDQSETITINLGKNMNGFIQYFVRPIRMTDLRQETLSLRFSDGRAWLREILEKRIDSGDLRAYANYDSAEKELELSDSDKSNQLFLDRILRSYEKEYQIFDRAESTAQKITEQFGPEGYRSDDDIERIVFGDEKTNMQLLGNVNQQKEDPWKRLHESQEREGDERTR